MTNALIVKDLEPDAAAEKIGGELKNSDKVSYKGNQLEIEGNKKNKQIYSGDRRVYVVGGRGRRFVGTLSFVHMPNGKKSSKTINLNTYVGYNTRVHPITEQPIEIEQKVRRPRQIVTKETIGEKKLPSLRQAKEVIELYQMVDTYRGSGIDARTYVDSLSKDVFELLEEMKAAGADPFTLLDRKEHRELVKEYGPSEVRKFLEKLEGYMHGEVSKYDADQPKAKRLTKVKA